ncbi:hypothetical protein MMF93_28085 [Streptomyces tubbatahanensis]|uniref:Uncharacterized protein n=1 Tax=Streptomyces tubbatahanensis TaxID=2923272 RepID=A0ABY3XZA2_9ACTN|nr:hypothetical protein [Streptomyces tubbatahanensis]UNS99884.1 hypothetical protein MMF93_28085 [Streptomyces tubbatahanensis]
MDNDRHAEAEADVDAVPAPYPRPVSGIAADLDQAFALLRQLRELAGDPAAARDDERVYDFSIRWGTLLSGRLERLAHYAARGELTRRQAKRYQELRTRLRDAASSAARLDLADPGVVPRLTLPGAPRS